MDKEYKKRIDIADEAANDLFNRVNETGNLDILDKEYDKIIELHLQAFDVTTDGSEEEKDFFYQISKLAIFTTLFKIDSGVLEDAIGKRKTLTEAELKLLNNEVTKYLDEAIELNNKNKAAYIEEKNWVIATFNEEIEKMGYTIQKGGCYIATAVYGSYDCPQVWILRRYRDTYLANNFFGQAFIRFYYSFSPYLVSWFGDKKWFNSLFHKPLDLFVNSLYHRGYADTPYEDLIE